MKLPSPMIALALFGTVLYLVGVCLFFYRASIDDGWERIPIAFAFALILAGGLLAIVAGLFHVFT